MTTTLNGNNSAALYLQMNDVPLIYLDTSTTTTTSSISSSTDDLILSTHSTSSDFQSALPLISDHFGHHSLLHQSPTTPVSPTTKSSSVVVDKQQISRSEAPPVVAAASFSPTTITNRQKDRALYNRLRKLYRRVRALYEEAIKCGKRVQKQDFYEWAAQVKKDLDPEEEWNSFEPSTSTVWLDMFIAKLKIPQVKIDEFNDEVLKLVSSAAQSGIPVTRENIHVWAKQAKESMEPQDAANITITDNWISMLIARNDIELTPIEVPTDPKQDDLTNQVEQRLYAKYQEAQSRGERVSRQVLGQWAGAIHRDIDPEKQYLKFSSKTSGCWVDRFMRKYNIPLERDLLLELENRTLKCYQDAVARKETVTMEKILGWSAAVISEIDPHKQMRCKGSHKWAGSFVKKHDIKLAAKPTKYPGAAPCVPRPITLTRQMEAEIDDVVYTKYAEATRKRQRVQGTQLKAWAREHIFSRFGTVDVDWNGDKWMNDFAKRHGMRLLFLNQKLSKKDLNNLGLVVAEGGGGGGGGGKRANNQRRRRPQRNGGGGGLSAIETVTDFDPDVMSSNMEIETSGDDEMYSSPMEEEEEDEEEEEEEYLVKEELKEHDYQIRQKTPEPLLTVPAIPEQIYPLAKNADFWNGSVTLGELCAGGGGKGASPPEKIIVEDLPSPEIEEVHMEDAQIDESDSDEELLRSRASSINLVSSPSPLPPSPSPSSLSPPISPQLPTLIGLPPTPKTTASTTTTPEPPYSPQLPIPSSMSVSEDEDPAITASLVTIQQQPCRESSYSSPVRISSPSSCTTTTPSPVPQHLIVQQPTALAYSSPVPTSSPSPTPTPSPELSIQQQQQNTLLQLASPTISASSPTKPISPAPESSSSSSASSSTFEQSSPPPPPPSTQQPGGIPTLQPAFQLVIEPPSSAAAAAALQQPVFQLVLPPSPSSLALPNITRLESFKSILNQMEIDTNSEYAIILSGDQAIDIIKMTPEMTELLHKDPLYSTQKEMQQQLQQHLQQ